MRRRELIAVVGAAAFFRASVAQAQQPGRIYRLGYLSPGSVEGPYPSAFLDELRRSGFVAGQNLQVDEHASVRPDTAGQVVMAMVRAGVDAISTAGDPLIRAVQQTTRTVPILVVADDLVGSGLVKSFAHPDGNTTGISILATELDAKRQQLLTELAPAARHIAALADPAVTVQGHLRELEKAARAGGVELSVYKVSKASEIAPAIDAAGASGAQGLNVLASSLFNANQQLIRDRTAALKLPAMYQWPEMAEAGGLTAYGPRFTAIARQSARQLVKIFHGAKPADLPVEQPDKFELVINMKTARALGLAIPPASLARADEAIQ